jgi:hypothetical protein
MASWLTPRSITEPGIKILESTNALCQSVPAGKWNSREIDGAAQYLKTMVRLYFPGLAGFALGGLVWWHALERRKPWARRALPAIAVVGLAQLILVNSFAIPTVPKSFYTYRPPVLDDLQDANQPYRFCYIVHPSSSTPQSADVGEFLNFDSIPEARDLSPTAQAAFRDRLLLARGSMLAKVEGVFNLDLDGSFPFLLHEFWFFALRQTADPERADCLLGRTNVKYQIARAHRAGAATREVAEIFNGSPQPSHLDENPCVAPRAYVAWSGLYSTDTQETLRLLSAPDFIAQNEVILAAESNAAPPLGGAGPAWRVDIVDRQPNSVTLAPDLLRTGYVVLLDRYDSNWHATVDGQEVPVLRANLLFRAVRAEAGKHEIRFYYQQRGLKVGLLITLATLAFLAILYALDPKRAI